MSQPISATALRRLATGLTLFSVLALTACGDGGGAPALSPPPVTPPPAPPSAAVAPAAVTSRSATRTLEAQDGRTAAGAQISTSSRYTLISEGVSP